MEKFYATNKATTICAESDPSFVKLFSVFYDKVIDTGASAESYLDKVLDVVSSSGYFQKIKETTENNEVAAMEAAASIQKFIQQEEDASMDDFEFEAEVTFDKEFYGELDSESVDTIMLAAGSLPGNGDKFTAQQALQIIQKAKRYDLSKIIDKLGRDLGAEAAQSETETKSGVVFAGIETGNDITKITPTELALPKSIFLSYYAEEKLVQYKYVGRKKPDVPKRGDFVLMVDRSSSIRFLNLIGLQQAATASCILTAIKANRNVSAIAFDSYPDKEIVVNSQASLVEFFRRILPSGGTDFDLAVDKITAKDRALSTDVLIITDGMLSLSEERKEKLLEIADRVHVIVLEIEPSETAMEISHNVWQLKKDGEVLEHEVQRSDKEDE